MFDIVVTEDGVRGDCESLQQFSQLGFAARTRYEITGNNDEVGIGRGRPTEGALNSAFAARRHSQVAVGQVQDPKPRETVGELRNRELEPPEAQPAGLEPAPAQRYGCNTSGACEPAAFHGTALVSACPA